MNEDKLYLTKRFDELKTLLKTHGFGIKSKTWEDCGSGEYYTEHIIFDKSSNEEIVYSTYAHKVPEHLQGLEEYV